VTLIELLVVVAIIGLLIGLLLPALQAARETSRRAVCGNKFRQFGLALQAYAEANGVLPPSEEASGSCSEGTPPPAIKGMSGLVMLLPMLGEQAFFDRLRMHEAFVAKPNNPNSPGTYNFYLDVPLLGNSFTHNSTAVNIDFAPFICPSERTFGRVRDANNFTPDTTGRTNYDFVVSHVNHGFKAFGCDQWRLPEHARTRSMFGESSACRWAHVRDGLGQTAMMTETRRMCCLGGANARWAIRGYPAFGLSLGLTPNNTYRCTGGAPYCQQAGAVPVPGYQCCYNSGYELADYATPGSHHPGGVGVLMGDGSVRFMTDETAFSVRLALNKIADGQPLGEF